MRAMWILPLLLGLWAPPADADLDATVAGLQEATAGRLDALAEWCTKKRVFGCRDDAYVALLEFDPEHRNARKRLRYTKGDDAAWVQDPRYKRAKDWSRKAAGEAKERLRTILAEHRAAVLTVCEQAKTIPDLLAARRRVEAWIRRTPGEARPPAVLRTVLMRYVDLTRAKGLASEMAQAAAELRRHHPEDREVRALLGEVLHDDRWVLVETRRTLRQGSGIRAAAQAALVAAKTKSAKPFEKESKIELPWTPAVETSEIRVAGTAKPEVLDEIACRAHATGALFAHALGRKPSQRAGLTAYVFQAKGEVDTFLAGYPVVDNPTLQQRKKIKLDLVYADGRTLVLEANPPVAQNDLVVNEVLNQMFADTFLKSEAPKGWHAEGISRYLAWLLTGTRLSIAVSGKYAGQGGDRHVPESGDPWLQKARIHAAKGVDLRMLLGKGTDVFTARDSIVAYAFAVYLLEGLDGVATDFITTFAKTADADRACAEVLGLPRPVVEHRLKVWLDEVTASERAAAKGNKKPASKAKKGAK